MAMNIQSPGDDQRLFAEIALRLQSDYTNEKLEALWQESPYAWIRARPSRQKGSIGERIVEEWCEANGLDVRRTRNSQADRIIQGKLVEIKFSFLWESGTYTFQQIRDQNYDYAIFLGLSPFEVHCWIVSKEVLKQHVIGHLPQHMGQAGSDTFWVSFPPGNPPEWLADQRGTPEYCLSILRSF